MDDAISLTGLAACDRNLCIGKGGTIPWHAPEDLRHFKRTTMGGTVVMGRRTWASLPIRPLPGRRNWVLSHRSADELPDDPDRVGDRETILEALRDLPDDEEVWVIGGTETWRAFWDEIDAFVVTHVDVEVEGCDARLPARFTEEFHPTGEEERLSDRCVVRRWVRTLD